MAERPYLTPLGRPSVVKAFDALKTITRRYKVQGEALRVANADTELFLPYATADDEFPLALLVSRSTEPLKSDPSSLDLQIVEVYQEFTDGEKVLVGEDQIARDESASRTLTKKFVVLATQAEELAADVGDVEDTMVCVGIQIEKQGVGAQLLESWSEWGLISESTQTSNNGALTTKTLVYLKDVPPTPVGYTLANTQVQHVNGVPTYTYTFAKGTGEIGRSTDIRYNGALTTVSIRYLSNAGVTDQPTSDPLSGGIIVSLEKNEQDGYIVWNVTWAKGVGEISRSVEYRLSSDLGVTGITVVSVRYLSDPSVTDNPIATPVGAFTLEDSHEENSGYRLWNKTYASGTGPVTSSIEYRNKGKLVLYTIESLAVVPTAPTATIGGTVVLIRSQIKREQGIILYEYTWAEGNGIISTSISTRNDGLREQTYVSLGTRVAPAGIVTRDDTDEMEGVTRYTVSCMQSSTGGDPTFGFFTFERYVPFTYPGRLKRFTEVVFGQTFLDVFKSPPVQTEVLATVTISYQASASLGELPAPRWQPLEGATMRAQWVGSGPLSSNMVDAWRDYRSVDETEITHVGSGVAPNDSILGRIIFGGTTARIIVTGGPPDPAASWTLDAHLDYAFTSATGTRYYRKTTVAATIPAQDDLPV